MIDTTIGGESQRTFLFGNLRARPTLPLLPWPPDPDSPSTTRADALAPVAAPALDGSSRPPPRALEVLRFPRWKSSGSPAGQTPCGATGPGSQSLRTESPATQSCYNAPRDCRYRPSFPAACRPSCRPGL